jgi:lia operon protein LiaG
MKSFVNIIDRERLIVEIPEDFFGNLDVTASSGSIKVEDEFTLKNTSLHTSSGSTHINKSISADTLSMKSSSGSIKLEGIVNAKDISAETTSGSIGSSMDIKADGRIELNTSSGSINIDKDITAKDIYAYTNSGGLRMENVYVEKYDLKTTSGSIRINSISGGGYAKTSSGSINLALIGPKGEVDLNTSSGSIRLEIEPSLQFTLTADTSSGGIKTNFPTLKNERGNHATASIGDNPTVNITTKASSGGIRIEN